MAKRLPHRISAVVMAALMMLSSSGIAMDMHFCQNQLKGINFFGEAKSCHEKKSKPPCHKTKKVCRHLDDTTKQDTKDDCCHNEQVVIDGLDTNATLAQYDTSVHSTLTFLAAFVAIYFLPSQIDSAFQADFLYKPPLPDSSIQILYQVFLI